MEYITEQERAMGMSQEPYGLALNELTQAAETGRDVSRLVERFAAVDRRDDAELLRIYGEALSVAAPDDWPHCERSDLPGILETLPPSRDVGWPAPDLLADRIRGAWFGRIAANMLGKPIEKGWSRAKIKGYLTDHDAYPLADYVPLPDEARAAEFGFQTHVGLTRGRVRGSVRDDDIDYTILGLLLLETYGDEFTTRDVAYEWLRRFPVYQLYTAERAAYQNLIREVPIEEVGSYHNPYREWIGAQIRADIFGYVSPGDPRRAALLAYRDAVLSHRANGIFGEMWAAALIATAFTAGSPEESVELSLEHIPSTSRLAVEIRTVLGDYRAGRSWEECMNGLDRRHERMSWVHAINNSGAIAAGILWGRGDYTSTIGLTVQAGLDTDSAGATAGSWAGAFVGYHNLPSHWVDPLEDRVSSAVFGVGSTSISALVERTIAVLGRLR